MCTVITLASEVPCASASSSVRQPSDGLLLLKGQGHGDVSLRAKFAYDRPVLAGRRNRDDGHPMFRRANQLHPTRAFFTKPKPLGSTRIARKFRIQKGAALSGTDWRRKDEQSPVAEIAKPVKTRRIGARSDHRLIELDLLGVRCLCPSANKGQFFASSLL